MRNPVSTGINPQKHIIMTHLLTAMRYCLLDGREEVVSGEVLLLR